MVGERGFEPPTPWSRKRQLVYKQQPTSLRSGASASTNLLILVRIYHSHSYGCPFAGAPSGADHYCRLDRHRLAQATLALVAPRNRTPFFLGFEGRATHPRPL